MSILLCETCDQRPATHTRTSNAGETWKQCLQCAIVAHVWFGGKPKLIKVVKEKAVKVSPPAEEKREEYDENELAF